MTLALAAILALLAVVSAGPASADPATLIITTFSISATWAVAAVHIAVGIAQVALANHIARSNAADNPGIRTEVASNGDRTPQSFALGVTATAGHASAPFYAQGSFDDFDNAYRSQIIDLSDLPITGINALWVDGNKLTPSQFVDPSLTTLSNVKDEAGTFGYHDDLNLRFYDGTQTTADPDLTFEFSAHEERPWTSEHVGIGVSYVHARFRANPKHFQGEPKLLFEVRGIPLYDPRKDGSRGGTGAHRMADRSTWEFSENPKVMQYNILIGIPLDPDLGLGEGECFGLYVDPDDVPLDDWFADMTYCDELVGTPAEPRFRAGIEVKVGSTEDGADTPLDIIDALNKACDGDVADVGGVWYTRCGPPAMPVLDITDDDIIRTKSQDLDAFRGRAETFNVVKVSHPDPGSAWGVSEAPERRDDAAITEDGEELVGELPLGAVSYRKQAQRLGRAWLKDARRMRVHTIVLPPEASVLKPFRVIRWTSERNGYATKIFEVGRPAVDPNTLLTTVSIRERNPDDYDWDESYVIPTEAISTTKVDRDPGTIPGFGVAQRFFKDATNKNRRSGIAAVWTVPLSGITSIVIHARHKTTLEVVARETTSDIEAGEYIIRKGIIPGDIYQIRGKALGSGKRKDSPWTAWLDVTAPSVKISKDDIGDGEITDEKILGMSVSKFQGLIQDAQMAGISASKLQGLVQSAQLNTVDAQKLIGSIPKERITAVPVGSLDGQLADAQIAGLSASKLAGLIADTQIAAVDVSKLQGQIADANIAGLSASKLAGLIQDTQVAAMSASKLTGTVQSSQIAALDATKLTGTIAEARIAALAAAKITGQITGVQITDTAITAPKIAGGAITAGKIATDAVTAGNIVAGAVTTAKLSIGGGGNLIEDSAWNAGTDSVSTGSGGGSGSQSALVIWEPGTDWAGPVSRVMSIKQTGTATDGNYDLYMRRMGGAFNDGWPAKANEWYEVHAHISAHRCYGRMILLWRGRNKEYLGETGVSTPVDATGSAGDPDNYPHYWHKAKAPAGTHMVQAIFRKYGTASGSDSWLMVHKPMLAKTHADATEPSPYVPGGVTQVSGGMIQTNAIVATHITGRTITAAEIATGTLTANEIKGRTITAANIVTGTIGANEIASRTITAVKIDSGTLTSNEISSRAINADRIAVGAITATEIKGRTITAAEIVSGTISANEIAGRTITAGNLVAGTITAYEIKGRTITANEIAVGTLTANEIAANAIGANQIAADAISARHLLISDQSNLVLGAELHRLDDWVISGSVSISGTSSSWDSEKVFSLSGASNAYVICNSQPFMVTPGERLYVSYQASIYAGSGSCYVDLQYADDRGITTGITYGGNPGHIYPSGVQTRGAQTTVPAGVRWARLRMIKTNNGSTGAYMGSPSVKRVNGGELIVDGAITGNKITGNTISGTHILGRTITAGNIVSGSITGNEINGRTITAGHIASGTLTANEINVGTITIETANIRNLAVETVKIAGGAVVTGKVTNRNITNYAWNFYSGSKFGSSGTETQVCNATISPSNDGNLHVQYSMELDTPDRDFSIRIRQNGFEIYRATHTSADANTANSGSIVSGSIIFSGNTSQTFELTVNIFPEGGSGTVENRFLSVTELMK